jgi:hypothetical protein
MKLSDMVHVELHKPRAEEGDTNPKKAHGALKAPMNAVPNTALIELNAVMAAGAHKYGIYNFRNTKIDALTYISAIRRHLMLWEDGQDADDETFRSHLAHIMACCALALDAQHTGYLVDNRSKTGVVPELLKDCARTHNEFTKTWRSPV